MEYFEQFKQFLISVGIWEPTVIGLNIFIPTMAMVYLFGRMLNIAKKNTSKNLVAAITAFVSSGLFIFLKGNLLFSKVWSVYFVGCVAVLFYVLIGFTLYSRVDAFFDKFAKDKEERKKK